jgi:surface antigen
MKVLNIGLLIFAIITAGCAADSYRGSREMTGGLAGAALGGLLGAQFGGGKGQLASTAAGVLIGGLIGSEVGRSMDEVDRMRANEAITQAQRAPIGERITWENPEREHYGSVTPTRDGYTDSGQYCREFHQTVTIGGRTEEAYGVACRQENGDWRIVQG